MNLLASVDERAAAVRHAQRVSGQTSALAGMIADADPFLDIAQQLLAARGSLDSLLVRLVELELADCLPSPETRAVVDGLLRTALGRSTSGRTTTRARRHRPMSPTSAPRHKEGTIR